MATRLETLASSVETRFAGRLTRIASTCGELTYELAASELLSVCRQLRDDAEFKFEQLVDVTGVDYLQYGRVEWSTQESTSTGFSRGVTPSVAQNDADRPRFAVVYHLLSVANNVRLRLRSFCVAGDPPMIDSVCSIWASANWFEREVFDLFGVLFQGHPDLRRILTDYGFIGHPFRKDFPLIGNVEVRYDPAKGRVVYEPVSIEPRTLVPRVIRDDNRYDPALTAPVNK
jgi:NADH-quinone oxidoreductase subunit C